MKKRIILMLVSLVGCLAILAAILTLPNISAHAVPAQVSHYHPAPRNIISASPTNLGYGNTQCKVKTRSQTSYFDCLVTLRVSNMTQRKIHWTSFTFEKYCAYNYPCTITHANAVFPSQGDIYNFGGYGFTRVHVVFNTLSGSKAALQGTITFMGPANSVKIALYASGSPS